MPFDYVFEGAPTLGIPYGPALGVDITTGTLYVSSPRTGRWIPSPAVAGGSSGSIQYNNSGAIGGASASLSASGSGLLVNSFSAAPSGSTRNDVAISAGFQFTVNAAIAVSQLGRLYLSGNTQNHTVNLWISSNTTAPIATGTVLASSPSDSNGYKWVTIPPITLAPGNTYVIAVDEAHLGDTWYNVFTPSLQAVFNTPVVSAYTLTVDSYPNDNASGNGAFSTPAMMFVQDTSVVNQSSPVINVSGNYWNGRSSVLDAWTFTDVLGSGSNPASTLTLAHSGTSGFASVSMTNLTVNSIVANMESVAAVASIGNLSSSGFLDVINTTNAFGNTPYQGTLNGINPYGSAVLDVATSAVGGGATSPSTGTSTAVAVAIGLESIPNSNQGGTGGGDLHGTGFISLKIENLIPSTNSNSAFYFSGLQASVDNWGSGDAYEVSAVRGFANNLGTSTQTFLLGGDFEVIQSAASGLTTTLAGVFTLASTVNAAANTTTSMYAVYAQAAHRSAVTLPAEYGLYVITGGFAGNITNDYGVYIDSPADAATMTNHYGIYMADQTVSSGGGTNPSPFAIYIVKGNSYFGGSLNIAAATPTGSLTGLGIGDTTGFGNGSSGTAMTTTTKSTGTGPTTPQTIVGYLEINIGGTNYWVPYCS